MELIRYITVAYDTDIGQCKRDVYQMSANGTTIPFGINFDLLDGVITHNKKQDRNTNENLVYLYQINIRGTDYLGFKMDKVQAVLIDTNKILLGSVCKMLNQYRTHDFVDEMVRLSPNDINSKAYVSTTYKDGTPIKVRVADCNSVIKLGNNDTEEGKEVMITKLSNMIDTLTIFKKFLEII